MARRRFDAGSALRFGWLLWAVYTAIVLAWLALGVAWPAPVAAGEVSRAPEARPSAGPTVTEVPAIVIVSLPGVRFVCWPPLQAETPGIWMCSRLGAVVNTCRLDPFACDIPLPREPSMYRRAPGDGAPA